MTSYYFLKNDRYIQRVSLSDGSPPGVIDVRQIEVGPDLKNCKINVTYDFNRDRVPSIFFQNQPTGNMFLYFADTKGDYVSGPIFGQIDPAWQLQVCRFFRGTGEEIGANIFGHNRDPRHPDYNKVRVWHTTGANLVGPFDLNVYSPPEEGSPEWLIPEQFDLQLGDFNGDGVLDIIGRARSSGTVTIDGYWVNFKPGDMMVWYTGWVAGRHEVTKLSYIGNIDLRTKIQVADMNGDGYADIFGTEDENSLEVWYNIDYGGRRILDGGHLLRGLRPNWQHVQVAYLKGDGYPDVLGQSKINGAIHGWYSDGPDNDIGSAPDWIPLACAPQTRVV